MNINKILKEEKEFNHKLDILRLFISGYELIRMNSKVKQMEELERLKNNDPE